MFLAVDGGLCDLGWAVLAPRTARVKALGQLHQERHPELVKSECRALRATRQADLLAGVARRHRCTHFVAEAMSFSARRFTMAVGLSLSWGVLIGVAIALGLAVLAVPPKLWQHAVLGRGAKDRKAVNYDEVLRALTDFIGRSCPAAEQLAAIKPRLRNHALDAVGTGVFAVLRPDEATRIGGP